MNMPVLDLTEWMIPVATWVNFGKRLPNPQSLPSVGSVTQSLSGAGYQNRVFKLDTTEIHESSFSLPIGGFHTLTVWVITHKKIVSCANARSSACLHIKRLKI